MGKAIAHLRLDLTAGEYVFQRDLKFAHIVLTRVKTPSLVGLATGKPNLPKHVLVPTNTF